MLIFKLLHRRDGVRDFEVAQRVEQVAVDRDAQRRGQRHGAGDSRVVDAEREEAHDSPT